MAAGWLLSPCVAAASAPRAQVPVDVLHTLGPVAGGSLSRDLCLCSFCVIPGFRSFLCWALRARRSSALGPGPAPV